MRWSLLGQKQKLAIQPLLHPVCKQVGDEVLNERYLSCERYLSYERWSLSFERYLSSERSSHLSVSDGYLSFEGCPSFERYAHYLSFERYLSNERSTIWQMRGTSHLGVAGVSAPWYRAGERSACETGPNCRHFGAVKIAGNRLWLLQNAP